jgi:chemotaxis signal transduction protein
LLADERPVETNSPAQYLTCRVARQDFAMLASRVRGILPIHDLLPIEAPEAADPEPGLSNSGPRLSDFGMIRGVATLRGRDLPVVDLRHRLGIAQGPHGRQPHVIVVEVGSESGPRLLGFVADRISEVVTMRERDFRNGSVRLNGRARRVLNPDLILTEEELESWNASLIVQG